MNKKTKYFYDIHTENASNLSDIIESVRIYLEIIQKNSMFLDDRNNTENVNEWLFLFIESNKKISTQISLISLIIEKYATIINNSDSIFDELKRFINENPNLTQDEMQTQSFMNIGSATTKQSNIKIAEILKERLQNKNLAVSEYIDELTKSIFEYNDEIEKLEMYLTLKHYNMNPIEKHIRNLFQTNELAIDLYNTIKENRFKSIELINIIDNG